MTSRHPGAIRQVGEHQGAFALAFGVLFLLLFGFLYVVGATPDSTNSSTGGSIAQQEASDVIPTASTTPAAATGTPEQPIRIVAKDINLNVLVVNPTSTDVTVLDDSLTQGAVRYPTSGLLGVNGTVLIFGHSSYLPLVNNLFYKTFDGIQNLKEGDIVSVYSNDKEYRYSVTGVRVADANDANSDVINLPNDAQYLTLVTCDSFALKTNRFIVTASFVGVYNTD